MNAFGIRKNYLYIKLHAHLNAYFTYILLVEDSKCENKNEKLLFVYLINLLNLICNRMGFRLNSKKILKQLFYIFLQT